MKLWLRTLTFAVAGLGLAGCPSGDDGGGAATIGSTGGDGGSDTNGDVDPDDSGGPGDGACILNNCSEDAHCEGCSDGRNTCFTGENRCVQCLPGGDGSECADGEVCTDFGNCVPEGLECPTDGDGNPTVMCAGDADCAACDPLHQVCADGACVACTEDNTAACQTTDQCVLNECVSQCPESCTSDSECANCGTMMAPAHACHQHACAECSETAPCPAGEQCTDQGTCVPICGIPGQTVGTCEEDADCAGCEGDNDSCNTPINGGHGVCGPSAAGCSDLGNGVVVLPAPFDQVTNLCSNDGDCAGIGIMYNVGQLLRDLTGINEIDDAIINYPMAACADVTVGAGGVSISCGVCVPCQQDDDCMDIDIDMVADDLFGPLGGIATAILLDQLFGDNDHLIHMFCQPVAAGYGICVPCPTLLNDCASGGGGGGSGMCNHDACTAGDALDPMCGNCAATICAQDPFCCNNMWDDICVGLVETVCNGQCTGGGCAHSECQTGGALEASCSTCAGDVCAMDDFCCNNEWDSICVDLAEGACPACSGGSACAHDECVVGGPLMAGCSGCAGAICGADSFCCDTQWDQQCVDAAGASGSCSC